jgi:hypothetical protein
MGAGAVLLLFPGIAGGAGMARLLTRTVGVRDLVLGGGQVWASGQDDGTRTVWVRAGAVSDVADVVVSLRSRRDVGTIKAVGAAGMAVPFVGAAVLHESESRSAAS